MAATAATAFGPWSPAAQAELPSAPVERWRWDARVELPDLFRPFVTGTALVARFLDTNGDGVLDERDTPNVIIPYVADLSLDNMIAVVDGATGATLMRIEEPVFRADSMAVGDVIGDGRPELVVWGDDRTLLVIDHQGAVVLQRTLPESTYRGSSISLADIDEDGRTDIVIGRMALLGDGSAWLGTGGRGNKFGPSGGWVRSIPMDLDPASPGMEVVAGNTLYDARGGILWQAPVPDGYAGVADVTGDGEPDIALVTNSHLYLLDRFGDVAGVLPDLFRDVLWPSPPVLADLTGDGMVEVVVPHVEAVTAYAWTGGAFEVLWAQATPSDPSEPGATAYDFNCDGAHDIIYRDENRWYVFNGRDGDVLYSDDSFSGTGVEFPLVADVDGLPGAQVVVPGVSWDLRVYDVPGSATPRPIFNQEAYHVTNVNDDGTIPRVQQPSWRAHNTFRTQAHADVSDPCGVSDCSAPSLAAAQVVDPSDCNRGLLLSWSAATFPSGAGSYAVYRSDDLAGLSCDDALLLPPLAQGLGDTSWLDLTTEPGRAYVYVVEAEDGQAAGAGCSPTGPTAGGTVDRRCLDTPIEDAGQHALPAGIGPVLRLAREDGDILLSWPDVRPLLDGEHFHVRRAELDPRAPFVLANGEGHVAPSWRHPVAATPWLLFYRLRVANACENESPDHAGP